MIVAVLAPNSTAHWALFAEGVEHEECLCEGSTGYGEVLADAWSRGGFILLEHDVVPWVGAVRELEECEGDWCSFAHAKSGRTLRSLGFVKFSDELTERHPDLPEEWEGEPWQTLESKVLVAAASVATVCEHGPAVGHARKPDGVPGC